MPRLQYYQDAHHYHAKRLDPPITLRKLQQPVDELLGTGVDVLVFGLGYGDVYFHQSKAGRVVGQNQTEWTSHIDWRIMRMVEGAAALGTDQLRAVIERGKEVGLQVWPSLKMQSCDVREQADGQQADRCGKLKWEAGTAVCIGLKDEAHPRYEWCYDWAHPAVAAAKLAMLREVMEDYGAEGVELDFQFVPWFLRPDQVVAQADAISAFVQSARALADEVSAAQHRQGQIAVSARVFARADANTNCGLDVAGWLAAGWLDAVVCQDPAHLFETRADIRWAVAAATAAGTRTAEVFFRPPRRVYDDRTERPSAEMYRALAQCVAAQGGAGMQFDNFAWPLTDMEYRVLREAAHPSATARLDKLYLCQPAESGKVLEELVDYGGGFGHTVRDSELLAPPPSHRTLPLPLTEGATVSAELLVSDDLAAAAADGALRRPTLTLRFSAFCVDDTVQVALNGAPLPLADAERQDERGLSIALSTNLHGYTQHPMFAAPLGMAAYWFHWALPLDRLREGANTVAVTLVKAEPTARFERALNGVEVRVRYAEVLERPLGLPELSGADRVRPRL
jgi:hypothetical protein